MIVTIKDVAARAGVSRSAVSRTFTEGASVSAKTREKVERAAQQLGYQPNLIARSLSTNRTKLIGLVANNFHNPLFLEIFDLFTRELQARGLRPLLVNLTDDTEPAASVRMLRQYNVDGVIVASSTLPTQFASAFAEANIPVVHTFGRYTPTPDVNVVGINNVHCGEMAAQTLVDHGYKRIAFLGGPKSATSTEDRAAGFAAKMKELGRITTVTVFADDYRYDAGQRAMHTILDRGVDAVFCGDDVICMGAMDAARQAGVRVPEDVGFLGFNDLAMAGWSAYDLATIRQPVAEIILSSVDLVVLMLENPQRAPETRLFPCTVVERSSLRPV